MNNLLRLNCVFVRFWGAASRSHPTNFRERPKLVHKNALSFFFTSALVGRGTQCSLSVQLQLYFFSKTEHAFAYCRCANVVTMLRLAGSALGAALVMFGPSCARADLVTFTATGPAGASFIELFSGSLVLQAD